MFKTSKQNNTNKAFHHSPHLFLSENKIANEENRNKTVILLLIVIVLQTADNNNIQLSPFGSLSPRLQVPIEMRIAVVSSWALLPFSLQKPASLRFVFQSISKVTQYLWVVLILSERKINATTKTLVTFFLRTLGQAHITEITECWLSYILHLGITFLLENAIL